MEEIGFEEEEELETYSRSERKLMETHELSRVDYHRISGELMGLIEEFGTEAIGAVTNHLINTTDDWLR